MERENAPARIQLLQWRPVHPSLGLMAHIESKRNGSQKETVEQSLHNLNCIRHQSTILPRKLFLFNLNHVIARLGEMIPDEMLRQETRQFTMINRSLLVLLLVIASGYVFLLQMPNLPGGLIHILIRLQHIGQPVVMLLVLLPLSLTMSLLWKTKEVIMDSLFTHR